MEHLGQFLQGFTQQVGAVIDDHVAELQVHMLPLSSPPGIRGAPASCQSLPTLPADTERPFMHLWHKHCECVCVHACVRVYTEQLMGIQQHHKVQRNAQAIFQLFFN